MVDIKPLDAIVEKYGRVTPARADDYRMKLGSRSTGCNCC